jgi:aminopeptidase-like protein
MSGPDLPLSRGAALHALAARLYRIPRSIAGPGVRETLGILAEHAPIALREIASGTPVLDWVAPREWILRSATLTAPDGRVVADAAVHNLHVVNYSLGFRGRVPLAELRGHLHSLPERPERIPYRTSYYREAWGFCLPHRVVESLPDGDYEVAIDAEHVDGALVYGEVLLAGETDEEVLLSTHCCHPQLANDNLSGLVVMTALAAELAARPRRRLSYRFLFAPGTIGAIAWLATHEAETKRVRHGLVTAGLGDGGAFHYKRTRRGDAPIDFAVPRALRALGEEPVVEPFVPFGYDERQYNSPGFRLPVGALTRTPWGRYPEYHTDADDLDFVRPERLERSLAVFRAVVDELESREVYVNLSPRGEPMLGRRGLYRALGGGEDGREGELALLWVLNLSDGETDLATVAERSGLPAERVREAAEALVAAGLLAPAGTSQR